MYFSTLVLAKGSILSRRSFDPRKEPRRPEKARRWGRVSGEGEAKILEAKEKRGSWPFPSQNLKRDK
jgi:hypothetical protein